VSSPLILITQLISATRCVYDISIAAKSIKLVFELIPAPFFLIPADNQSIPSCSRSLIVPTAYRYNFPMIEFKILFDIVIFLQIDPAYPPVEPDDAVSPLKTTHHHQCRCLAQVADKIRAFHQHPTEHQRLDTLKTLRLPTTSSYRQSSDRVLPDSTTQNVAKTIPPRWRVSLPSLRDRRPHLPLSPPDCRRS